MTEISSTQWDSLLSVCRDHTSIAKLSPRERDIFFMVLLGNTNESIAGTLGISQKTVETHRSHINKKLKVHSTPDILRFAVAAGVLTAAPKQETVV